jgi:predicted metalloprotease with PDZ domain
MRRLWQRSAAADHRIGTEEVDIRAALAEVAGPDHAEALLALLDAAIHGRDELPLPQLLAQAGIDWQAEPGSWSQRLGLRLSEAGGALKVQSVARGGAAETAGVSAGDEWLALGGWRVRQSGDAEALGVADQPLALLCVRDQRVLHLTLPAVSAEVGQQIKLLPLAEPDESALALRRVWLGA